MKYLDDDRVLLAWHNASPRNLRTLRKSVELASEYFCTYDKRIGDPKRIADRILGYLSQIPKEFDKFKEIENEICHFQHIHVELKDISDLKQKIETVKDFEDPKKAEIELKAKFDRKEIDLDTLMNETKRLSKMVSEMQAEYNKKRLKIKNIARHYYIPVVMNNESERIDYIKHIVQEPSEVKFLEKLDEEIAKPDNIFSRFNWWFFSKIDEALDEVYIPYLNPNSCKIDAKFKPDFIFWLKKKEEYFIVFVDPKGAKHADYQHKIDGYKSLFWNNDKPREILHEGQKVCVLLRMFTNDCSQIGMEYRDFWFDTISHLCSRAF